MSVRTRTRRLLATLAVAPALLLTGCLDTDTQLQVHEDQTVSGTVRIAVSNELLKSLDIPADPESRLFKILRETAVGKGYRLPAGTTSEPYVGDGHTGEVLSFPDVPFAEAETILESIDLTGLRAVNVPDNEAASTEGVSAWDFDVERTPDGPVYAVQASIDLTALPASVDSISDPSTAALTITVPGQVLDHDGAESSTASPDGDFTVVTWNLTPGEVNTIDVRSQTAPPPAATPMAAVIVAAILGGLLACLGLGTLGAAANRARHAASGRDWAPRTAALPLIGPSLGAAFDSTVTRLGDALAAHTAAPADSPDTEVPVPDLPAMPEDAQQGEVASADTEAPDPIPAPDDAASEVTGEVAAEGHVAPQPATEPVNTGVTLFAPDPEIGGHGIALPLQLDDPAGATSYRPLELDEPVTTTAYRPLELAEPDVRVARELELTDTAPVEVTQLYPLLEPQTPAQATPLELVDHGPVEATPSAGLPELTDLQVVQQITPGWYQTADGSHLRWYDGEDWTEHVHPVRATAE